MVWGTGRVHDVAQHVQVQVTVRHLSRPTVALPAATDHSFHWPAWVTSRLTSLAKLTKELHKLLGCWTIFGIWVTLLALVGSLIAVQRTRRGENFEYLFVGRWARQED